MKRKGIVWLKCLAFIGILAVMAACSGSNNNDDETVARAGDDQNVATGTLVTLDGSASEGDGGLVFAWSFVSMPAGSAADLSDPAAVKPTFTADLDGDYLVELLVTAKGDSNTDTVTVTASTVDNSYIGVRTQAYVEVNNALDLAEGGDLGLYGLYSLPKLLKKTVALVKQKSQVSSQGLFPDGETCINFPDGFTSDSLEQSESDSIVTISGNVTFTNCAFAEYVEAAVVIFDGTVSVSATYDKSTDLMTMFEMTMTPILADYHDGSAPFNVKGRMAGSESHEEASGYQVFDYTIEATMADSSGHSYWLNNYHITDIFDEELYGTSSMFSGRYYDNEYGYADFTTIEPIFVPDYPVSHTPYSGLVQYTGSDGSLATILIWGIYGDKCINGFNLSGTFVLGSCTLF